MAKAKNVSDMTILGICNGVQRKHTPTLEAAAAKCGMKPASLYQRMNKMRNSMMEEGYSQEEVDELLPVYSTSSGGTGQRTTKLAVVDMFAVLRNYKAQAQAEAEAQAAAALDPSLEGDVGDDGDEV